MTTPRTPDAGLVDESVARLALLADPTRRPSSSPPGPPERHHPRRGGRVVGISPIAGGIPPGPAGRRRRWRSVTYERRNGRSGPGAGRPAKVYHRSTETVAASVPGRRLRLAAALFAQAIEAAVAGDMAVDFALAVAAADVRPRARRSRPVALRRGRPSRAAGAGGGARRAGRGRASSPTSATASIVLRELPIRRTRRRPTATWLRDEPLADGRRYRTAMRLTGTAASIEPRDGACCVVWRPT